MSFGVKFGVTSHLGQTTSHDKTITLTFVMEELSLTKIEEQPFIAFPLNKI